MPVIEPFWREWREAWAARRLVFAVVDAEGGPLTTPETSAAPECRAVMVCDAVERRLERLACLPGPDDTAATRHLRTRLAHLARACGLTDRGGRDQLLGTAFALWGDAVRHGGLREKLERRADTLAGPGGAARLQRLVKDALWEAEAGDGIATRQRRRKWKGVREVSFEILPDQDWDSKRCTLAHFTAVADRVRQTRPHDRNLPRTPDAVGELFYLFCPCCVGMADPRLPGYAGRVQERGPGVAEGDVDAPEAEGARFELEVDEMVDVLVDVAPEQTKVMITEFKAAVAALPAYDQVVLSNLLGDFGIVGRAARRAYPTLDAPGVESRDRTAAILGVTRWELDEDRRRMDAWRDDMSRRLQHGPLPAKGAE